MPVMVRELVVIDKTIFETVIQFTYRWRYYWRNSKKYKKFPISPLILNTKIHFIKNTPKAPLTLHKANTDKTVVLKIKIPRPHCAITFSRHQRLLRGSQNSAFAFDQTNLWIIIPEKFSFSTNQFISNYFKQEV